MQQNLPQNKYIYHLHMTSIVNIFLWHLYTFFVCARNTMHEIMSINLCHLRTRKQKKLLKVTHTAHELFWFRGLHIQKIFLYSWPSAACKITIFCYRAKYSDEWKYELAAQFNSIFSHPPVSHIFLLEYFFFFWNSAVATFITWFSQEI